MCTQPPNLASNSITSSCLMSLLWVALPVQSSSRNLWNDQVHLSFRIGLNISHLTPCCGSSRKGKWLESFWPSQVSTAFGSFCNSQSPGTSSVITCLSHFSSSLRTVVAFQARMWLIRGKQDKSSTGDKIMKSHGHLALIRFKNHKVVRKRDLRY